MKDVTKHDGIIAAVFEKNNLDPSLPAKRYTGGQINFVYQIGDDLVLKVEKSLDVTPLSCGWQ